MTPDKAIVSGDNIVDFFTRLLTHRQPPRPFLFSSSTLVSNCAPEFFHSFSRTHQTFHLNLNFTWKVISPTDTKQAISVRLGCGVREPLKKGSKRLIGRKGLERLNVSFGDYDVFLGDRAPNWVPTKRVRSAGTL